MACYPREGVRSWRRSAVALGPLGWLKSDTPEGPFKLVKNNCLMAGVDQANSYYSMRSVEFKGERLAFACGDKLSLGVKLSRARVVESRMSGGRTTRSSSVRNKSSNCETTSGRTVEFPPAGEASFMLTANLKLGTASAAGITFQKAGQGDRSTLFLDSTNGCFDWVVGEQPGKGRVAARTWPLKPGSKHTLRVVSINQHIVVYIDDNYVINGRGLKLPTAGLALAASAARRNCRTSTTGGPKMACRNCH